MKPRIYKITATTLILSTLLLSAYVPIGPTNNREVRAGIAGDVIGGAAGCAAGIGIGALVGNLLGSFGISVSVKDGEALVKDQILDCIAWIFANIALEAITAATVSWINSGFDGNPAYVDDLEGFVKGVGDATIGTFIQNSELEFLCSPFKVNIKAALLQRNRFDQQITCTLTDVVENIDGFMEGNFRDGGWRGWFEMTQKPQNNPYGVYMLAEIELSKRMADALKIEEDQLSFGKGFLSWEKCEIVGVQELKEGQTGPPDPITECEVFTPGSVIDSQLNDVLTIGGRRLSIADELNEVLGALFTQLLGKILSSDGEEGGLKGAGGYISRLSEEGQLSKLPDDEVIEREPVPEGGQPAGSCDFGDASLSGRAQDTVVNVSRFPTSGNGAQVVFLDGGKYRVDTRINGIPKKYPETNKIRKADDEFCIEHGPCEGGSLSQADQESVLALNAWAASGGDRAVALRFETNGVHVDWYSQQSGTGQFGPLPSITATASSFCAVVIVANSGEGGGSDGGGGGGGSTGGANPDTQDPPKDPSDDGGGGDGGDTSGN